MWNPKKSLKLSVIITDIFIGLLIIGAVALPWLVTWYVEFKHRSPSLPATVMLTCYPCAPFAMTVLVLLRRVLKDIERGSIFTDKNASRLKTVSLCCFAVTAIMLFSGRFYLPFYVCAICTAFIGLILRVMRNIIIPDNGGEKAENGEISG